jgi:hypothetical protein
VTPFELVRQAAEVQDASKRELVAITRRLERAALEHPPVAVAATLQDVRHLSDGTRAVYAELAARGVEARLHARGLQSWLAPGVVGIDLTEDDPLADEWVVVLPGRAPVVFAATDLHAADCADADRSFRYGISHDPHVVASAGRLLGI